jgi:hypothetical protein
MNPLASLSLALDNLWSYMKTHGDPGWERFPSYLDLCVPKTLALLAERDLTITFFVVGQDAAIASNHGALAEIARAGHEIGNHSFRHEPWLHLYSEGELEEELLRAEDAIERATGRRPRGFRGPGFSVSNATLEVLKRRDYDYDASTLPTYVGPLARAYYFWTARLDEEERAKRKLLFGSFSDGRRPVAPYRWRLAGGTLTEIPVTTMPGIKLPFHVSYLLYLNRFANGLGTSYFKLALAACRAGGVAPSLLLHPLDFLGGDEVPELAFFPAMSVKSETKRRWTAEILDLYRERYRVVPMADHAAALESNGLPERSPAFPAR